MSYKQMTIIGEDRAGNKYRLPVKAIIADSWRPHETVIVELPFTPDHRVWEELRHESD